MTLARITSLSRRIWRSQRGSVAIHIGLVSIIVIGMVALGVEISMALYKQRQFQMFADTSAYSGAVALKAGQDPFIQANAIANQLALNNNTGTVTVSVNSPIATGRYAGENGVEATVSQQQSLSLVDVVCGWYGGCTFNPRLFNVAARAVAIINAAGSYCVLALSKTASPAIKVSGGGNVTLNGCSMRGSSTADPSIWVTGGGKITATVDPTTGTGGTVTAAGTVTETGGGLINAEGGIKQNDNQSMSDPFSGVTPPAVTNPCPTVRRETEIESSCTFASAGKINLTNEMTLKLGTEDRSTTYVFNNDLSITGGKLEVENATIVLTGNAQFSFTGNGQVTMTASSSGPLKDIAVIGYRQGSNLTSKFAGGSNQSITGSIYLPTQNLSYAGGSASGSTRCLELIANTVEYTGAAQFSVNCVGHALPSIGGEQVNLVE